MEWLLGLPQAGRSAGREEILNVLRALVRILEEHFRREPLPGEGRSSLSPADADEADLDRLSRSA